MLNESSDVCHFAAAPTSEAVSERLAPSSEG